MSTRKLIINFAVVVTAALAFTGSLPAQEPSPSRPNILFALADDWGWPHAGAYGDRVVKTPTFDRLAREGILFDNAYVSSPSCTPSRNAVLTGQQFYRLGQGASLWSTLDPDIPNFMFQLRDNGYEIGHWRKAWGPGDFTAAGYTENPCGPRSSFADFMARRDKSKPFCFWFGTSDPHRTYKKNSGRDSGMDIDAISVPGFFPDNETVRGDIADYYFEVQRWDRDVGAALELLEQAGELDNTIIVMSGDHGMPFPRCKGNLYDGGARVPMAILWGDTVKPGRRVTDFVSFTDLAPTFLAAAGVEVPEVMTGRSLLPILMADGQGRVDQARDFVVFGRERHTPAQRKPSTVGYPSRGLRTDRWLLILNLEPGRWPAGVPEGSTHSMNVHSDCDNSPTKSFIVDNRHDAGTAPFYRLCFERRPAVELYDCRVDPFQINNLAGDPESAATVEELRKRLTGYLEATGDPRFNDLPVEFDDYPYRRGRHSTRHARHERIEWSDIWIVNADKSDLPRVLLVGDSIVRGYYSQVERHLSGKADCARYTTSKFVGNPDFLSELGLILERYEFDVIHVNNGLHGWDYTEMEYAQGLRDLLDVFKRIEPDAALIWCQTTPARSKEDLTQFQPDRNDRVVERNRIAAEIMNKRDIPINDLYEAMKDHPEYHSRDGVHFNNEGKAVQGAKVAEIIGAYL